MSSSSSSDSIIASSVSNFSSLTSSSPNTEEDNSERLNDKKGDTESKTLFVALMIIGIIAVGAVGGSGIANLGNHLGWWSGAGFKLSQMSAIVMAGSGGGAGLLFIIGGLIGLIKSGSSNTEDKTENSDIAGWVRVTEVSDTSEWSIEEQAVLAQLHPNSYSWLVQKNKNYTLIIRYTDLVIEKYADIHWSNLEFEEGSRGLCREQSDHVDPSTGPSFPSFVRTSPLPEDLEFSDEIIKNRLTTSNTFTFVLQCNGLYTLIERFGNTYYDAKNYVEDILYDSITDRMSKGHTYVPTSELPPSVLQRLKDRPVATTIKDASSEDSSS